jgi:hypothetical protein
MVAPALILLKVLCPEKSLRPLKNDSSLLHWHDNYAIAIDNNDVPWRYRHPGATGSKR